MIDSLARLDPRVLIVGIGVVALVLALPWRSPRSGACDGSRSPAGRCFSFWRTCHRDRRWDCPDRDEPLRAPHARAGCSARVDPPARRAPVRADGRDAQGAAAALPGARRRMADRCARAEVARSATCSASTRSTASSASPGATPTSRRNAARRAPCIRWRRTRPRLVVSSPKTSSSTCRSRTRSTAAQCTCRWPRARSTRSPCRRAGSWCAANGPRARRSAGGSEKLSP